MLLPIGDENPRERTPYVNYALLGANIAVFFLLCFPQPREETVLAHFAMKPSDLRWHTLLTSMFLHATLMHLAGNMLFLWIFGDNVEDRLGHLGYLAFYCASGLGAGFAHIATDPRSEIFTLGASGAISGVVAAYAIFFPRHRVKMLLWLFFWIEVLRVPAVWWIGFWFLEQVLFASLGMGGVAWYAHIGGFVAGGALAGLARVTGSAFRPAGRFPAEIREPSRTSGRRHPFITLEEDPGIVFIEDAKDRYAVLRLSDDLYHVGRIAQVTAGATGEDPRAVGRRLEATRGLITGGVPRAVAERIQRNLRANGIETALVLDHPANRPPWPLEVRSLSWDDRSLRFTAGDRSAQVGWAVPFLYMAARMDRSSFIDFFINRHAAFRVPQDAALTFVDARLRREFRAELEDLARAILVYRSGAALNEGIHVLAHRGQWGWLAFRNAADYADYVFWTYNLILSKAPLHRL